jgi:hypothetical protein
LIVHETADETRENLGQRANTCQIEPITPLAAKRARKLMSDIQHVDVLGAFFPATWLTNTEIANGFGRGRLRLLIAHSHPEDPVAPLGAPNLG